MRETHGRRAGLLKRAALAALLFMMLVPLTAERAAAQAAGGQPAVRLALSKDAYWYTPDSQMTIRLTIDNDSGEPIDGATVRVRFHSRIESRTDFDATLNGKPRRSYWFTQTFELDEPLKPGANEFEAKVDLAGRDLDSGVYPISVDLQEGGETLATAVTCTVIMKQPAPQSWVPLRLSLLFDVLEPPHQDTVGAFKDSGIAVECTRGSEPGFIAGLIEAAQASPMRLTFAFSPLLLDEMREMTDGYSVKTDGRIINFGRTSNNALAVSRALESLKKMAEDPRFQFLATPYASPQLETICDMNWYSDAEAQSIRGQRRTELCLDERLSTEYFYPPALMLNSKNISRLGNNIGERLVLSPALLERSKEGKKLERGDTLCQPVEVKGASGRRTLALFADARLQALTQRLSTSRDAHGVAQCVLSEVTNLYMEHPEKSRACVLVWPSTWRPPHDVMTEVLRALSGAPWLSGVTFEEAFAGAEPLQTAPLDIPQAATPREKYFEQVDRARVVYSEYSTMVFPDNPAPHQLLSNVFISESDVWRQWDREREGLTYADSVINTVNVELAKLTFTPVSQITLTSEEGKIPLTIRNETGYKVKTDILMSSDGLDFPDGSRLKGRVLQTRENNFEVPVKVTEKGRVRFAARLAWHGRVYAETAFPVKTSRFSTFAIILVSGLLGVIVIYWSFRTVTRSRSAKHKKRRAAKEVEEEQGE